MANTQKLGKIDGSSIVEMTVDDDNSDYDTSFTDDRGKSADGGATKGLMEGMEDEMKANVTSYMWKTGSNRAKQVFNLYANIDLLRPYFDVEPREVRSRLLWSLIPQRPGSNKTALHGELYGPSMIVLTLIAILLFQMKTSGHTVPEGTLMGSAFAVCFGYWLGVASLVWFLSYVCDTHVSMLQLLSLLGYALFGHCVVLFASTVFHPSHSHVFFYVLWAVIGGLSTLKMVSVLMSRTAGRTQKLIICSVIASLHLLFLIYLHFAYHQIVEELSSVLDPAALKPVFHKAGEKLNQP